MSFPVRKKVVDIANVLNLALLALRGVDVSVVYKKIKFNSYYLVYLPSHLLVAHKENK